MAFSFHAGSLQAQTWTGATSGNFGTNTNWSSNVTFGTSANLTFSSNFTNANSTTTPAFTGAARIIRSLNFDADADNDIFIRLTTNATNAAAANLTFQAASGSAELAVASGATGNYTIGISTGNVVLGSNLLVDHNGGGNLLIDRVISGTGFGITKNGTGTLTLNGTNTYTGGFNLNSGKLNVNSAQALGSATVGAFVINGGTIDNTSAGTVTMGAKPLTINSDMTYTGGSQSLSLGTGATTLGTAAGTSRTITVSGNSLTIGGVIANGTTANSIIKAGAGALVLGGANTFDGGVVLNAGSLLINNNSALGTGNLTLNGGAFSANGSTARAITNNVTVTGDVVIGDTTNNGTLTFNTGTFAGASSTNITKNGSGILVLAGVNTFSGNMIINSGTIRLDSSFSGNAYAGSIQNNGTLHYNTAGQPATFLDLTGNISGTGKVIQSQPQGILILSGSNTFSGGVEHNSGVLRIASSTALGTGIYTIANATVMSFNNTSGGSLVNANNNAMVLGGNTTFTGTNSYDFGTGAVTISGGNQQITVTANTLTLGGVISDGGNAYQLTKAGGGTLALGGGSTFSGGLVLSAGTLAINSASALGSGTFTIAGTGTSTIDNTSGAAITNSQNNAMNWNADFTFAGTKDLNLGTGAVTMNASRTVTASSSATLTVGGVISGSGFSLTKAGTGTLALGGANTFSGGVVLNAGTLAINNASALGNGTFAIAAVTSIDNTSGVAVTNSQNNAISWNANLTFIGTNDLNLGTGAVTMNAARTATVNAGTLTLGGGISGNFALTKAGAGTLVLSGNNSYSGATTISAGTLSITEGGLLGQGNYSQAITNNGIFRFSGSNNQTLSGVMSGNGGILHNGTGTLFLTANNTYTGSTTVNGATLQIGNGGTSGNFVSTGGISNNGILAFNRSDAITVSQSINGTGSLFQNGSGTLILTGANSYSGNTTISAGTLQIGAGTDAGSIGSTSGVNNNGFLVYNAGAGNRTLGANISGTGSLTKNGSGTLALGGANTFSGGVVLNAGTLAINNASALGNGTFAIAAVTSIDNTSGATVTNSQNNAISWNANLTFIGTNDLNLGTGAVTMNAARTATVNAGTLTLGGGISGNFALTKAGAGTLVLSGNNSYSSATTISAGTLSITDGGLLGQGNYSAAIANNGMFRFSGSNNQTLSGVMSGTGGLLQNSSGTLFLTANNSFTGNLAVEQGAVSIATINNASANGTLGNNANSVTLGSSGNTGTLSYTGSTASSTKAFAMESGGTGAFEITNGATALTISGIINGSGNFEKSGSGTLILTGANSYSGNTTISAGTLQIGAGTDAGSIGSTSGVNNNGFLVYNVGAGNRTLGANISGTGRITKNGTGVLTLSGSNSYNGATTVNGGSLIVSGSTASSAITINSGATLGGSGTVGTLVINSGATLSPGNSPGTITVGNTSWEGGGNYNWQIYNASGVAGTGWDFVSSAGTLTINSSSGNKFNINLWSLSGISPDANGTPTGFVASNNYSWTIASFASVTGFDAANFAINSSATNGTGGFNGFTGTFSLALSGGNITIDYAAPNNSALWTGGTGNWSTGANWQSNSAPTNGVPIDFAGTGGTSTNNSQLTSVTGLTFTANATGSYTVNGSALDIGAIGIANDSSYAQTVSSNLTMTAAQSFSATGANLTVSGAVNNGGYVLTFTGNNSGALSGVVSGNGSLVKSGSGPLTISGNNSYTGGTTINAGTIQIRNASALGTSGTIAFGGGTLQWGNVTTDLSSRLSTAGGQNFKIDIVANNTVSFGTALNNAGGTLTKEGVGTLQLAGANTLSATVINSGTLRGGNSANTFGGSSALITLNGGELRFSSNFNNYGNDITVQSNSFIHNISSGGGVVPLITFGNLTLSDTTLTVSSNNASQTGNVLFNGTTTLSGNAILNVGTSGNNSMTLRDITESGGSRSLTKTGVGALTLNGSASYTGTTTISAGTLKIGTGGSTGSLASSSIVNNGQILVDRTGSITLSAAMSGTGSLTKNSSGTLTLSGSSSYSGGTILNSGTLVICHANAAGSGMITQGNSSSLLKLDTTGTIANSMSVYNVLATQNATASGAITVNNATFEVEAGDTLELSGAVSGSGGVTKNGTGTLILSGSNSYTNPTTINAGTLNAGNANALGSNAVVTVNGGSLLVTADDAINGKNITLNSTSTTVAGLVFNGTYNGTVGALTLSRDSILDLGTGSVAAIFSSLAMDLYNLKIYNWSGTTLWGGGDGDNTDRIYFNRTLTTSELGRISFYSSLDNNSLLGTAYQFASGSFANEIIPVPEPSTYLAGLILLVGTMVQFLRRRRAMEKMS